MGFVCAKEISQIANENGITTRRDFIDSRVAERISNEFGLPQVIIANNVLAHSDNLQDIFDGICQLMSEECVLVIEFSYLLDVYQDLIFDTIYHEHLRYYSVEFLTGLFEDFGLEIINISRISTHGGSIRVWAAKKGVFDIQDSVKISKTYESTTRKGSVDQLEKFVDNLKIWRHEFRKMIAELILSGGVIAAIGAPSRASTLISFSGLTHLDITAVGEIQGSHKIGRFMPGTSIAIIDEGEVIANNPDYLMILSWHIAEELIPKIREKGFKGKFIIPLPYPKIVD